MKIKVGLVLICLLVSLNIVAQYSIVSSDSIPVAILNKSKSFAFDFYNFSKSKNFTKFITENGNLNFLRNYIIEEQNNYSKTIYDEYGNITKVVLHEVLKDTKSNYLLRYKGYYDKKDNISEIRIFTNSEFKFTNILLYPWFINKFIEFPKKLNLEKLSIDSFNREELERVHEFAYKSFRCNSANFPKLTTENAVKKWRNWSTNENMNLRCESIYDSYGSLKNIKLHDVLSDGVRTIYRYKAEYDKTDDIMEIIVLTNVENKFIGSIFIGSWRDEYVDFQPEKQK